MSDKIKIHPITPHQKRVFDVSDRLKAGDICLFPTDSQYAIGCSLSNKKGIDRIRKVRRLKKDHLMTLLCDSLSNIAKFGHLEDDNFKFIKRLIPGPYTFILPATKELPKAVLNPNRKTLGFRVPDYPINLKILEELKEPIIATTAKLPDWSDEEWSFKDRESIIEAFDKIVDIIIDDQQSISVQESTIIDLTENAVNIIRKGIGYTKALETAELLGRNVHVEDQMD